MGIIELPAWRLRGELSVRAALRAGVAEPHVTMRLLKSGEAAPRRAYCDCCATSIEFGAVTNGLGTYCSVECSLEGPSRPA